MDPFEKHLQETTNPETRELLAAIALVVNSEGEIIYKQASGGQSLAPDAAPVDTSATIVLGSAGKFMVHIAALQLVDQGLIGLDEPVYAHLPELSKLPIISKSTSRSSPPGDFALHPRKKHATLRNLITHSSGIASPDSQLVEEWKASKPQDVHNDPNVHPIVKMFSFPLLFEPGEGWYSGSSVDWLALLISRVSGRTIAELVKEKIFDVLGMSSSTFAPSNRQDLYMRRLQMVRRDGSSLVAEGSEPQGVMCSVEDLGLLLTDLISRESRILKPESIDQLFSPQFSASSPALKDLRGDTENYAAPAGIPESMVHPPVNYSLVGLLVEDVLPLSRIPKATATWNGMPNVIWAINREKGLGMVFATQLLPVDDQKAVDLAMDFMTCAWNQFG